MVHTSSSVDPERLAGLGQALERTASWVRRMAPRGEHDIAAMSTLDAVAALGPMRVSALAARERLSQPGMTGVVDRLARAGLVARRSDPQDRRASLVEATEAGRAHLRARHAARATLLAEHIDRLTEGQQRALLTAVDALNALTAQLTSGRHATAPPPQPQPDPAADPAGTPATGEVRAGMATDAPARAGAARAPATAPAPHAGADAGGVAAADAPAGDPAGTTPHATPAGTPTGTIPHPSPPADTAAEPKGSPA